MGYSISWLAVKDADPDAVCKQLGLVRSGAFDGYYSYAEHSFLGGVLETGWYIVVCNRCDDPMVLDEGERAGRRQCASPGKRWPSITTPMQWVVYSNGSPS